MSKVCSGTAVEEGLVPPIKPAWDVHLRDGVVTLGGDGMYYLTGSSGDNIWAYAKGIELWKSADLKSWEYMGLVWDIDKEADEWVKQWRKHPRRAVRAVWAPEIHYIRGNYFICFSMCPRGIGILKSATGKPEGPYVNAFKSNEPIVAAIDATLFEDEDGEVYTYAGATRIARLNKEMDGFAEDFRTVIFSTPDTIASHHATGCVKRNFADIGHEGAVIFKYNGKYYMLSSGCTGWDPNIAEIAVADSIMGTWKTIGNPCTGPDADKTFYAQSTYVQPVVGKKNAYIAMFDRWKKKDLEDSRYVWLPVLIKDGAITIPWHEKWDLTVFDKQKKSDKYKKSDKQKK